MKGSGHPGFGHVAGEKGEKTRGRLTARSLPPASHTVHPQQADPLLRKVHPRELGRAHFYHISLRNFPKS